MSPHKTLYILLFALCNVCCHTVAAQPPTAQRTFTIEQLLDSALASNIAMREANRAVESAKLQQREAFTNYFPSISGTVLSFTANREIAEMDVDMSEYITPELATSLAQLLPAELLASLAEPTTVAMMKKGTIAGVNATLPVFAGGQIINGNRLSKVGAEVAQLKRLLSRNDIEKQLTDYFWQLATLHQKSQTLDAVDSMLTSTEKDATTAVNAGLALRNDLLQVQLRRNEIASNRLKLNNGKAILNLLIAQFCHLSTTDFDIAIPATSPAAVTPAGIIHTGPSSTIASQLVSGECAERFCREVPTSVAALPEYRLLEANVKAATLQRRIELGKLLPTIAIGAGYNFHNVLDKNRHFGMLFATASVPVTDWWGGSYAIRRKRLAEQEAREKLEDNAQLLAIRQQKAANDLEEAKAQIQLAETSISQAEENLRIQRDTYQAGTSTMSDLLKAQMLLQQALDARTDAIAAFHKAQLAYRHATSPDSL